MQLLKTNRSLATGPSARKFITIALVVAIVLVVVLSLNTAYQALRPTAPVANRVTLSQARFEQMYGVRVSLIAVTAAGGMVDLRLKITDGEKAKRLLADHKNFPLVVANNGIILHPQQDLAAQKIEFIAGGNLFMMYPNAGNAVLQGAPVTILFGDIALEAINSR